MYRSRLNRKTLLNHLQYDWWKYILGISVTVLIWYLATLTLTQTPPGKKVDIFMVGEFMIDGTTAPISEKILKDFPELQEINIANLKLDKVDITPGSYITGRQKLTLNLAAKIGDIYVFDEEEFNKLAQEGFFISLDPYMEDYFGEYFDKEQLDKVRIQAKNEENPSIHGLPLDQVTLFDKTGYEAEGKVLSIMVFSENQEKALEVAKWIFENGMDQKST